MCGVCDSYSHRCASITDLLRHLRDIHELHVEVLSARLADVSQFEAWRTQIETDGGFRWTRTRGSSHKVSETTIR